MPASLRTRLSRQIVGGDFEEEAVGIGEVDGEGDVVVAELEGDAFGLELGLGGLEVSVGGGAEGEVPGLAILSGRLIFLFGKEGEEGGAKAEEDGDATAMSRIDVLEAESGDIPVRGSLKGGRSGGRGGRFARDA
jgi:hypothetical protein